MDDALVIDDQPLAYVAKLDVRDETLIDLVVIHCTELPDLAAARACGERIVHPDGTGNSGHYYIDRDGTTLRYVPDARVAHHTHGYNPRSIGIELVNRGRWPDWYDSRTQVMTEPYPAPQVDALLALLDRLSARLPNLGSIAGHEDLDRGTVAASNDDSLQVRRKRDPGPMFPWRRVLAECRLRRLAPGPSV